MTETGKVREIKGNTVIVVPDISAVCFGCMNQECKTGSRFITAENISALPIETGQTVEVKARDIPLLGQALAALLPPVMGFTAGFSLTRFFFPEAAEGAAAAMGVLFLFTAAFIVYKKTSEKSAAKAFTVTKIITRE